MKQELTVKVDVRIVPFLFLCYILAYLDRVNLGFAKLQMMKDLAMSDAIFAGGAGIFFIGYFFFEVPSNVLLKKFGARRWIARIMISWGVISACMIFGGDGGSGRDWHREFGGQSRRLFWTKHSGVGETFFLRPVGCFVHHRGDSVGWGGVDILLYTANAAGARGCPIDYAAWNWERICVQAGLGPILVG
ncbi:MAG: MFS transporter [Candidatus Sulfotelmatobacter sp.]